MFSAVANIGFAGEPAVQLNSQVGGAKLQGGGKGEGMEMKSKVNEWKSSVGPLVARLQDLYAAVRDTFGEMGIGNEIIPWLAGDGRNSLVEKLKVLGAEFVATQAVPEPPKIEPTVVELGVCEIDRNQKIAAKLVAITDPKKIGYKTDWATDEKFPDARTGKVRVKASAVRFNQSMAQDAVEKWCADNKKILALPKDGIDIARVSPRPQLDNVMPLALAGQFFVGAGGLRAALYLDHLGGRRRLGGVWLRSGGRWHDYWWFLVLEEL